jgi:hypothetical protein
MTYLVEQRLTSALAPLDPTAFPHRTLAPGIRPVAARIPLHQAIDALFTCQPSSVFSGIVAPSIVTSKGRPHFTVSKAE